MANTKNILKVLICCILTIIMIVPNMTVFAANGAADKNVVRSNITAIEKELLVNNTDVISEINAMIADYTSQSLNTTEDTDKTVGLIATLEEMRDEYTLYNAGISTYKFHAIYSPAVTAVVAFFNMMILKNCVNGLRTMSPEISQNHISLKKQKIPSIIQASLNIKIQFPPYILTIQHLLNQWHYYMKFEMSAIA